MEMLGIKEEITNSKLVFMSKQKLEEKYEQKERSLSPEEETRPDVGGDNQGGRPFGKQFGRTGTENKNAKGDRVQEVGEGYKGGLFDEDPKKSKQLELFPVSRPSDTRKSGSEKTGERAGKADPGNGPERLHQNVSVGVRTTGNLEYHRLSLKSLGDITSLLGYLVKSPHDFQTAANLETPPATMLSTLRT